MSEFSNSKEKRIKKLLEVSKVILETGNARSFIIQNKDFISTVVPNDFITLFDKILIEGYDMNDIKVLTNKLLNIFHIPIRDFVKIKPDPNSFLWVMEQNNCEMEMLLDKVRSVYKKFVKDNENSKVQNQLKNLFKKLEQFTKHYTIKENVLFPVIEEAWIDYRCIKIMWSFHDDIRRNIKTILTQLQERNIDQKSFNKCVGDVFFNMKAIKFREENILFPYILSSISKSKLESINHEGFELGYPFIQPKQVKKVQEKPELNNGKVNLETGILSLEQIRLIFNHLPVDITFVDEDNKVCFFSTPPKRIFPRTNAIIGREVGNCHPPESVHVVEKIVESFKSGKKDHADFWIKMKKEYVFIQYFAVRDEFGNYKGVVEVSQEISDIKALEGEKRLLDW